LIYGQWLHLEKILMKFGLSLDLHYLCNLNQTETNEKGIIPLAINLLLWLFGVND